MIDQGSDLPPNSATPAAPAATVGTNTPAGAPTATAHPQARPAASHPLTVAVPLALVARAAAIGDPRDGWEDKLFEAMRTGLAELAAR